MTLQEKINKEPYFKAKNLTDLDDIEYSLQAVKKLIAEYGYTPKLNAILTRITTKKSKLGNIMKFKKGSKQAKDYMAKLRASRGKNTLGAVKKKKSAPKKKKLLATESKSLQATLKKKKLALPHGYELKKRKLSGVNTSTYKTMAEVRRANARNGYFFFSPKTMKFFGSKVVSSLLMGKYFITSEKQTYSSGKTETDYIVREVENNANIVTLKKFSTKDQAKAYLKTIH